MNTNTRTERDERLNTADPATRARHDEGAPERRQADHPGDDQRRSQSDEVAGHSTRVAPLEERVEPDYREYRAPDAAPTPTPGMPAHVAAAHAEPDKHNQVAPTGPGGEARPAAGKPDATPLLGAGLAQEFRTRWESVQAGFVDDPRRAVEAADHLVAEAIQQLARTFADERSRLEKARSDRGSRSGTQAADPSTEDMRVTLQRYRTFFHRLLSI